MPLQWWIGQDTTPSNLGEYLIAHVFTHFGDGAGMAIDLLAMKEDILEFGFGVASTLLTDVSKPSRPNAEWTKGRSNIRR